jgi:hypothetical protein
MPAYASSDRAQIDGSLIAGTENEALRLSENADVAITLE